jgi:hypothetical protein
MSYLAAVLGYSAWLRALPTPVSGDPDVPDL